MNDFKTYVDLNVFPLGSYDLLIGMNWLEEHRVILNCYNKTFLCTMILVMLLILREYLKQFMFMKYQHYK
jgi:hypothetical protein